MNVELELIKCSVCQAPADDSRLYRNHEGGDEPWSCLGETWTCLDCLETSELTEAK